jgi:hypothetical protein
MTEITIALGIPHTPWIEARVASGARLVADLGLPIQDLDFRIFTDRAPNHVWSAQMWRWAAETDATYFLSLQDDAIVATYFWAHLREMVEAVPGAVICLEAVHPATRALADEGHAWYTTADGVVGVGYVVPREALV